LAVPGFLFNVGYESHHFMEKAEIQQQATEVIDKAKALIADPATPSSHKSVLAIILGVVLKFLPVLIDIFHHATNSPAPPAPVTAGSTTGGGTDLDKSGVGAAAVSAETAANITP